MVAPGPGASGSLTEEVISLHRIDDESNTSFDDAASADGVQLTITSLPAHGRLTRWIDDSGVMTLSKNDH